jgi:ferredoxin-NADP reductase/predicted pyridoxine 5'-phosphate oxidase superfamily flavin-nucleotide-binding protein
MDRAELDRPLAIWHPGELAIQRSVGVAERMADVGRRVIRDHLIDQHREFYPLLPFIVLGAVDPAGDAWVTLRGGRPGFLHAASPRRLSIRIPRDPSDPAEGGMEDGDGLGLLGIDLITRRRNRLNGTVQRDASGGIDLAVEQSYGNCPQYIQLRQFSFTRDPAEMPVESAIPLEISDERVRLLIERADTLFVASYVERENGRRQVDASHRGGKPGFVRLDRDGGLTIPDFAGNLLFNTLGNFLVNPKGGLVFPDFETGDLLQLTGHVEVILDSPEIGAFQGAERLWRFRPRRILYRPGALPLRWQLDPGGQSPNSLMTGSWAEAERRQKAAALAQQWRPFRVAKIVDESAVIRSFHLEPTDGAGLIAHAAGQFLPIRVTPGGSATPIQRTYTLSVAPSDGIYRISVKREGVVSSFLHESVRKGDIIEARGPDGGFILDALEHRPAVLLAGGIGVTPLLAMLRHIVYEGLRKRRVRPSWFFYAARSKAERAFDTELAELIAGAQGQVHLVRVLSNADAAVQGEDYDALGRIDMALLTSTLPFNDYDFYLCGPPAFTQAIYDGLRGLSIRDARIHAEAFGPGSLNRTPDQGAAIEALRPAAKHPVHIAFATSGKEARWTPDSGSLLDLAEARGLSPEFSCREGNCGTCRTRILRGAVTYTKTPSYKTRVDEVLICCAVPAAMPDGEDDAVHLDL